MWTTIERNAQRPTAVLLPAGGDAVLSPFVARANFCLGGQFSARNARRQQARERWLQAAVNNQDTESNNKRNDEN